MIRQPLDLGCTRWQHDRIGIDAVINARGGMQALNSDSQETIELCRDAAAIRRKLSQRIRWYGPMSKFFRRNRSRIEHLIDRHDD